MFDVGAQIALVDCNNLSGRRERVLQSRLRGLLIVVLSNKDSFVIAPSTNAKALDIDMGAPQLDQRAVPAPRRIRAASKNSVRDGFW